jgi:hypothetical protein
MERETSRGTDVPSREERVQLWTSVVAAVVAGAVLRFAPGLAWRRHGMDSGYHLLLRREIRRHGMRMPARVEAMHLDERQTYPWGYHWMLALLPERLLRAVPPLPTVLIDGVHTALVALLAGFIAPRAVAGVSPAAAALAAGLLFATSPALLVVGIGPRAYEITPRPLGELLYSIVLAAAAAGAVAGGGWPAIVAAALAGGFLLLSSKFAAQVLLFTSPLLALGAGSWLPLALPPLALAAALVISRGRYRYVLAAHVRHLLIFRRRIQHEHSALRDRNDWPLLGRVLAAALRQPTDRAALAAAARVAEHNTILQFALRNVLWIGVMALVVLGAYPAWGSATEGWRRWLVAWAAAPLAPFVVTSVRSMRFLGEAERYPEYAVAAVSVLAGIALMAPRVDRPAVVAAYALLQLPALGYSFMRQRWSSRRGVGPEMGELRRFLSTVPPASVVVPVPWYSAYVLAPDLELRFLASNDASVWYRDYDRIFTAYPWPVPDREAWRRTHGASLVLVETPLLKDAPSGAPPYQFADLPVLFENARFRVYALNGA